MSLLVKYLSHLKYFSTSPPLSLSSSSPMLSNKCPKVMPSSACCALCFPSHSLVLCATLHCVYLLAEAVLHQTACHCWGHRALCDAVLCFICCVHHCISIKYELVAHNIPHSPWLCSEEMPVCSFLKCPVLVPLFCFDLSLSTST